MGATTTTQRLEAEHPYWGVGLLLVLLAVVLVAFDLGFLFRCAGGMGLCFDPRSHGISDAALIGFLIVFLVGLGLILYATAGAVATTSEGSPSTTVVTTPSSGAPAPVQVMAGPVAPPPSTPPANTPATSR